MSIEASALSTVKGCQPLPRESYCNAAWNKQFGALVAYKADHGDCNVPRHYSKNTKLADWVHKQRTLYSRIARRRELDNRASSLAPVAGSLTLSRIERLEAIGFVWDIRAVRTISSWEEKFQTLVAFRAEHGHCNVSSRYKKNPKLADWVRMQRAWYKKVQKNTRLEKGNPSSTIANRIERLEAIGFEWTRRSNKGPAQSICKDNRKRTLVLPSDPTEATEKDSKRLLPQRESEGPDKSSAGAAKSHGMVFLAFSAYSVDDATTMSVYF